MNETAAVQNEEVQLPGEDTKKEQTPKEPETRSQEKETPKLKGSPPKKENHVVLLKKVLKVYGEGDTEVAALRGVNLQLTKGSVTAIMGPSGSGKSTLINLIGSLDVPTKGEVVVDGVNLEHMSAKELTVYRREKVGFVFQTFNLLPNLSAVENVELPMEFVGKHAAERRERALKLLKSVKLENRADHIPGDLSGGERQRVAIARALANNPAIILADEPTGNLDTKSGEGIIKLLKELATRHHKTLLMVTHDMKIAEMTDRIVSLEDGKIESIRDVGQGNIKQGLSRELGLQIHLVERLFSEGFDTRDKILQLTEGELMMKNFKKKDKEAIMARIDKFRRVVTDNICHECNVEIPLMGVAFCPYCGGDLKA
jgi:putative ABC transport system ATP-binding protein